MIGLTALAILVVYILSVRKLARFIARLAGFDESAVKVGVVFVVLLLLPFVDEIVGRVQFKQECKKVQGYTVYDAIKGTQLAKRGGWPPPTVQVPAFIPITKRTSRLIDVKDGTVVMTFDTLSTPGGWVMRAGLNLGNESYCNSVNDMPILSAYGFKRVEGGFFKRISGGDSK